MVEYLKKEVKKGNFENKQKNNFESSPIFHEQLSKSPYFQLNLHKHNKDSSFLRVFRQQRMIVSYISYCNINKIKMDDNSDQQFTMRQDIILFNDALSHSGHNIKSYRKRHQEQKKSEKIFPASTQYTQIQSNNFIFGIENSDQPPSEIQSLEKMRLNFDKLPMRRKSITAGNTRKKNFDHLKTQMRTINVTQHVNHSRQNATTHKSQLPRQNNYKTLEKQFNKGPLKEKYLECWLNSILVEACYEEKFDFTMDNPALKKFQLDKNSLLSKGIKVNNLTRIYKSLFVYSIGFNDLLNEVCSKNMSLRKSIWKVYAILLQYCAQGSFQSMIAQIQRDKTKKLDSMRSQIQKRQHIIENNQQINEQKNAKIYKQIKYLKQQNQNLLSERQTLLEEFKQAEQAFNQEVSLRLKFENRINQIHGVYTEIKMKHERLVKDFEKNKNQLLQLRTLTQSQKGVMHLLKLESQSQKESVENYRKDLKIAKQTIRNLQGATSNTSTHVIHLNNTIKELQIIMSEKQRELEQRDKNYQNLNLMYMTEKKEHQDKSQQFLASLDENSRLHQTIQEQMKELNRLYQQSRDFGLKTSQIRAEIIVCQRKKQEKSEQIKQKQAQIEKLKQSVEKTNVQLKAVTAQKEQIQKDLKTCYQQIKEMKIAKNTIEDNLQKQLKKISLIDQMIETRDKQINQKTQLVNNLKNTNSQQLTVIKNYQTKINILNQRIAADQQASDKKYQNLKEQKIKYETLHNQFSLVKQQLQLETQKYRDLYEKSHTNLKNQLFERNNLDILYKQSLNVMEHQNTHIKDLNIEKSQLHEQIFQLNRKFKNLEFVSNQREKQIAKDRKFWQKQIQHLKVFHRQKKQYIHPMIFQDIASTYFQTNTKYQKLKHEHLQQSKNLKKQIREKEKHLKQNKLNSQKQVKDIEANHVRIMQKKENQIKYERQKKQYYQQKNKELEQLSQNNGKQKFKLSNKDEQRYLQRIQENQRKINQLIQQLEEAHDQNTRIKNHYLHLEQSNPEKDKEKQITMIQEIQNLRKQVEVISNEKDCLTKKVEQVNKKISEIENDENNNLESRQLNRSQIASKRVQSGRKQKKSKNDNKYETINWKSRDNSLEKSGEKRGDFARKYKATYNYYHK